MTRFAALAATMLLAVCAQSQAVAQAPAPSQASAPSASSFVELTNAVDGTRVALKTGGELKVMLDANPQTVTHWVNDDAVGPVLSPIGQRVLVSKSTNVADYSAGSWNIFRYRAEKPGKVTLKLEARRFDQPGAALRTLRYDVTVE